MWSTVHYSQDETGAVTVTFYDANDRAIVFGSFSTFDDADTAVNIATKLASVHATGVGVDDEEIEIWF